MKKTFLSVLLVLCGVTTTLWGQLRYASADTFPLLGKVAESSFARYARLPEELRPNLRPVLWELSTNSAGLCVRFRTNSTSIGAQWELTMDRVMNHMTPTGIKGLDLYCWDNGTWRFVNSGRPKGKVNQAVIIQNMEPQMREYMLYLPLYDGVSTLQIGIDSTATLQQPEMAIPRRERPIVCYGSSILQGGCATRPGMAHTNILSRRFNREFINLGFSGNALLDLEIAKQIALVDASLFILDFVPNASVDQMNERMISFYRLIRDRHPKTPILFVEDPPFTTTRYDAAIRTEVNRKNETVRRLFDQLKAEGEKNIHFLPTKGMIGEDGEATVDGVHFTDLGFMRYADLLEPVIRTLLKKEKGR